ncbi:hypothetical protein [Candidatus Nesciobacter abundans]|uniref:Uncharacterized protein n=1 Tax=Candidatus Nesciobacter abundans TaxID=2601668 RepID=A0A5C0UID4_9PROT|nr:hypothetical protein [Candidatus Nesciobacter abundans]QEK39172.1 hypothetical protein FZC36_01875 [Candidatus Nesciobacter abundans]
MLLCITFESNSYFAEYAKMDGFTSEAKELIGKMDEAMALPDQCTAGAFCVYRGNNLVDLVYGSVFDELYKKTEVIKSVSLNEIQKWLIINDGSLKGISYEFFLDKEEKHKYGKRTELVDLGPFIHFRSEMSEKESEKVSRSVCMLLCDYDGKYIQNGYVQSIVNQYRDSVLFVYDEENKSVLEKKSNIDDVLYENLYSHRLYSIDSEVFEIRTKNKLGGWLQVNYNRIDPESFNLEFYNRLSSLLKRTSYINSEKIPEYSTEEEFTYEKYVKDISLNLLFYITEEEFNSKESKYDALKFYYTNMNEVV